MAQVSLNHQTGMSGVGLIELCDNRPWLVEDLRSQENWALAVHAAPRHGQVMNENIAQWVAVVVGVAFIVTYSGLMIIQADR